MSDKTLFLIQTRFADTPAALAKIKTMYGPQDQLVLMGEAVLFVNHPELATLSSIAILASDAEMMVEAWPDHVHVLDAAQFADCVLQFTRCMSLK